MENMDTTLKELILKKLIELKEVFRIKIDSISEEFKSPFKNLKANIHIVPLSGRQKNFETTLKHVTEDNEVEMVFALQVLLRDFSQRFLPHLKEVEIIKEEVNTALISRNVSLKDLWKTKLSNNLVVEKFVGGMGDIGAHTDVQCSKDLCDRYPSEIVQGQFISDSDKDVVVEISKIVNYVIKKYIKEKESRNH